MYNNTEQILKEYHEKKDTYDSFCDKIYSLLYDLLVTEKYSVHSIDARLKEEKSLADKLERKQWKYKSLSEITDIVGIRIITHYADSVDIISKIIESEFLIDTENSIDRRKLLDPDRFGYLSQHYIISLGQNRLCLKENTKYTGLKAEIQIRSIVQHAWAEIQHGLGYKSKEGIPKDILRDFSRLAGLLELADKEFVSIRERSNEYRAKVKENIKDPSNEILLDAVSLEEYLESKFVIKLNRLIADSAGWTYSGTNNVIDLQRIISQLKYVGFSTISDIEKVLTEYEELVQYVATSMLDKAAEKDRITSVTSLYYLCYAMIIIKKLDLEKYMATFNILYSKEFDTELRKAYQEYQHERIGDLVKDIGF